MSRVRLGVIAALLLVLLAAQTSSAVADEPLGSGLQRLIGGEQPAEPSQDAAVQGFQLDSIPVTVKNTAENPVPVVTQGTTAIQDVDHPARQPYHMQGDVTLGAGTYSGAVALGVVPEGKRFVIEFMSVFVRLPSGQGVESTGVYPWTEGPAGQASPANYLAVHRQSNLTFVGSEATRIYADGGQDVTVFCARVDNAGAGVCSFTLTGHLVDQ